MAAALDDAVVIATDSNLPVAVDDVMDNPGLDVIPSHVHVWG
ncbi:hypothetical protein A11S_114 [Micavibrio aeruginosavorus EPB]|uniref:Uncharacterized protein n=1 Tax=Micavibrio aeruginosavorus EPB TaxID=349215 RepID=M4VFX5_9BACT|nr:hypothetical protein A11S_114 [Micavibrio aeruginosavorus EPB]